MALTKVNYVDNVTVIGAANLNAIQDEIIANGTAVNNLSSNKVDKETGKGLSKNDFTDEAALKLSNIEAGATKTIVDDALNAQSTNPIQNKVVYEEIESIKGTNPYAAFEEKNVSSSIASFSDGADNIPVKNLTVNIDPVQDLHGYDHPWPAGGGKNKLPYPYFFKTDTKNGCTATVAADGTVSFNGTPSANSTWNVKLRTDTSGDGSLFLPEGEYILNGCPSGGSSSTYRILLVNADGTTGGTDNGSGVSFTVPSGGSYYGIQLYIASGYNSNSLVFKPMIRLPSVSDATFSPYSNICPITGHTSAKVTRTGKNLLDGSLLVNPTTEPKQVQVQVKANTEYTVSTDSSQPTSGVANLFVCLPGETFISGTNGVWNSHPKTVTTGADGILVIGYRNYAGTQTSISDCNNQLELGSTATPYEPYVGETYDITFPSEAGTVYGGTLDVTSGVLTMDKQIVDGGDLGWVKATQNNYKIFYADLILGSQKDNSYGLCNRYITTVDNSYRQDCIARFYGSVQYEFSRVAIRDDRYSESSADEFRTAMSGVQLVYELATPITYTLTPTEVTTLLGTNNIWADTGDANVTYRATNNTSAMIKLTKALIAPVLNSMVADTALVVNDFRIVGDTLYKVTAPIASGGTLTVGTNVAATTIGEQITALLNS